MSLSLVVILATNCIKRNSIFTVSEELEYRIREGVKLFQSIENARLLLCGCNSKKENYEYIAADIMLDYIRSHYDNIDTSTILRQRSSRNTIEDALYTRDLLLDLKVDNIYVVTSKYHLNRALYIFRKVFSDINVQGYGVFIPPYIHLQRITHEEKLMRKIRKIYFRSVQNYIDRWSST